MRAILTEMNIQNEIYDGTSRYSEYRQFFATGKKNIEITFDGKHTHGVLRLETRDINLARAEIAVLAMEIDAALAGISPEVFVDKRVSE